MRPVSTSWPPIHSRKPTAAKTMKITSVVMMARRDDPLRRPRRRPVPSPRRSAAPRDPPGRRPAPCARRRASRRLPTPCRPCGPAPRATAPAPCGRTAMIGTTVSGTTASVQQRELGVGDHQHDDAADAHQRVAQRHRGRGADHLLDELRVGRDAAHDVARALDLEPGRPQPHDMGEEVAAQVAHHPLAQPRDQVEARARGDAPARRPRPAARPAHS